MLCECMCVHKSNTSIYFSVVTNHHTYPRRSLVCMLFCSFIYFSIVSSCVCPYLSCWSISFLPLHLCYLVCRMVTHCDGIAIVVWLCRRFALLLLLLFLSMSCTDFKIIDVFCCLLNLCYEIESN